MNPGALAVDPDRQLASHDILSVRRRRGFAFERGVDRDGNMTEAARILDAKWEDSRVWARDFFPRALGTRKAFTADVLVTILDSVREDVQAFRTRAHHAVLPRGRRPSARQRSSRSTRRRRCSSTTNYLTRYAKDAPDNLGR